MGTTVTQTRGTTTTKHEIDFGGLSGLVFWMLLISLIVYIVAFATTGWYVKDSAHAGLWEACVCGQQQFSGDWFKATQAMISIGLIFLVVAFVLGVIYMFFHRINKDLILILLLACCGTAVVFMLIGIVIFGVKTATNQNYSYAFAVISTILTLVATVIGLIHMRNTKKV